MDRTSTIIFVILVFLFILGVLIYGSLTEKDFWDFNKIKTECPEGTVPVGTYDLEGNFHPQYDDAGNIICQKEVK